MLRDEVTKYATLIFNQIENNLKRIDDISKINSSDGRSNKSPEYSNKSSYIYFLYSQDDKLIYIGETGQKLKNRLFSDGSGAHKNKKWFKDIAYLKYYKNDNMDDYTRKAIERLLILKFDPKYNRQ